MEPFLKSVLIFNRVLKPPRSNPPQVEKIITWQIYLICVSEVISVVVAPLDKFVSELNEPLEQAAKEVVESPVWEKFKKCVDQVHRDMI